MTHLSRLSEELDPVDESAFFGFIDIADRFCTGGSVMPQKRTRTCRNWCAAGWLRQRPPDRAADTDKSQPLAYNKDNQEDKEPLFRRRRYAGADLDHLRRHDARHQRQAGCDARRGAAGLATATDLTDYLVKRGLPFRDAHEAVALAVRFAEGQGCDIGDLSLEQLRQFSPLIEQDVFER